MKYLLISDTHGRHENYRKMLNVEGDVEGIYHCGDVEGGQEEMRSYTNSGFLAVRGNCDYDLSLQQEAVIPLGRHKIYMTHGHRSMVNLGPHMLVAQAKKNGCDLAFYGHTHKPFYEVVSGVTVVNPGSLSLPRQSDHNPSYVVMEVDDEGEITFTQKYL